jgi:hypothetical protein
MKRRGGAWILAAVVFFGFYAVALHGMRDDPSGGGANVGTFPAQLRPILAGAVACAVIGVSVFVMDLVYRQRKKGHE